MVLPVLDRAPDNGGDVGDAAAAHADRNAGAGSRPRREPASFQLLPGFGTDVSQPAIREMLSNEEQAVRQHQRSAGAATVSFIRSSTRA
jgi:hypothetical protein